MTHDKYISICKPAPTIHDLKACQFSSWYSTFRNLHKIQCPPKEEEESVNNIRIYPHNNVTIRSIIIKPLPIDFINYLQTVNGIQLPIGAEKVSSFLPDLKNNNDDDNDNWSSSIEDDDNEQEPQSADAGGTTCSKYTISKNKKEEENRFYFPQLNEKITNALKTLGPSIPKLNWSCPKDVSWMNGGDIKCSTVGDVYLLLQSSDFCMFDLTHALDGVVGEAEIVTIANDQQYENNNDHEHGSSAEHNHTDNEVKDDDNALKKSNYEIEFELVLRKWSNLHPSMEFRCFVSNDQLGKYIMLIMK